MKSEGTSLTTQEIMEFTSTKRWILRLETRRHTLSKYNLKNRYGSLRRFCNFHKKTPDELIEEANQDYEIAENRLNIYYQHLIQKISENSATTHCWSILRGFYRHNKINTKMFMGKWMNQSEVKNVDRQLPLFEIDHEQTDRHGHPKNILRRDIINTFFRKLSERDELIGRILMCTGLDIGEVSDIRLSLVLSQIHREKFFYDNPRAKTGIISRTFFCKDCTRRIKEYIQEHHYKKIHSKIDFRKEKLFPDLNPTSISKNYLRAFLKLNQIWKRLDNNPDYKNNPNVPHYIQIPKEQQQPLRPKRFRSVFITACQSAKIEETYIDIMTGASGRHSKSYTEDEIQTLEIFHDQVEQIVSLEPKPKVDKKIKNLEDTNKILLENLGNMEKRLAENEELTRKLVLSRELNL